MSLKHVKSEIAGKVWQIDAVPGTQVEEDDPIVTLESMKMEIPISAPVKGEIVDILVSAGDEVTEGQVVAKIEESRD